MYENNKVFPCRFILYGENEKAQKNTGCPKDDFFQVLTEDPYYDQALFKRLFYGGYLMVMISSSILCLYIIEGYLFSPYSDYHIDP